MRYIPHKTRQRAIMAAGIGLALAMGAALAFALPLPLQYELQHVDAAGELWILDHGLTRDDCRARMADFPAGHVTCKPVYSTDS